MTVQDTFDQIYAAWSAGDADAFANLYTEDATVVMPAIFHHGREAIREYMTGAFAGPLKGSRGVDEPQDIRVVGDTVIVVSKAAILFAGEQEIPAERERRATWVLSKQDDRWLVSAYTNTPAY